MRLTILLLAFSGIPQLNTQDNLPSNKHFWYSVKTTASPNAIWTVWTDVENWKEWDSGLKDASVDGDFILGANGIIISLENRKSKFEIVEYIESKSYTIKTKLPLGSLYVKRFLISENGIVTFTHEVWFDGLSKGLFAKAFGGKFRSMLPDVLLNIKIMVEK